MKVKNIAKNPFCYSKLDENYKLDMVIIKPNEVKEVSKEIAESWLKTGKVIEYVEPADVKSLEKEIEQLKAENNKLKGTCELDREALKKEADELGITYAKNIGAEKLLAKINDFKANN